MKPQIYFMGMFFFMISCRIVINLFPYYNMGPLSTLFVGIQYLCIFMALIYSLLYPSQAPLSKNNKILILIFTIYTIYTFIYNFVNPQLPANLIYNLPKSPSAMALSTICIVCCLFLANRASIILNHNFFAKISVIVIVLTLLLYFNKVDYTLYAVYKSLRGDDASSFAEEVGLILPLNLNKYVAVAYVCNLFCKDEWSKRKLINNVIFIVVAIYLIFISLVLGERGPVLFMMTSTMFYYFSKGKFAAKYFIGGVIMMSILFIFSSQIMEILSTFAPDIIERTLNIAEDGGSGRFGSDDSVYNVAINQILDNPLIGSYHRLLTSKWVGGYPHNVILEALMTFGLVFSIPLFYLMVKSIKNAYWAIRMDAPMGLFGLLFVHITSCLLTSGTMFLNHIFWVSLAMTLTCQYRSEKDNSIKTIKYE